MTVRVHYTRSWMKLWIVHERTKIGIKTQQNMYLNFGVAEEMIHYGLHHLRHDTEEGPYILPKELRRLDPVKVLQDLFRRKMLLAAEIEGWPVKRLHHCPEVEFNLYWEQVYKTGSWCLTPLGTQVLQAVKEFFLAESHGQGTVPLYSLNHREVTDEALEKITAACAHWGFNAEFLRRETNPHVLITPKPGTWWLKQFPRFEDRLEKLIPLAYIED